MTLHLVARSTTYAPCWGPSWMNMSTSTVVIFDWSCCAPRTGFCQAVLNTLRVVPDGVITLGPPCSSFTWVNSGTSKRSRDRPYGDESRSYVNKGSLNFDCIGHWPGYPLDHLHSEFLCMWCYQFHTAPLWDWPAQDVFTGHPIGHIGHLQGGVCDHRTAKFQSNEILPRLGGNR